jgi:predicted permease
LILPGRQSPAEEPPDVIVNHVSPGFFETMGMTILRGRGDPTSDAPKATGLVVNDSLARRYFPTVSPVGQRAGIGSPTMIEITGVARDAKYDDLRTPDAPAVFITSMQSGPQRAKTFEVRSVGDPLALAGAVRRRIAEIDRDLMVYDLKTESQQAGETIAAERLTAQLAACFGSLALIMAAIGLYGVIAFNAARRTSEIGIRVALGAQRWSVMWLVLRSTLAMAALGIAAGLPAALLLARLASSLLFGVSAADPPSILAAVALLLFSAVLAAAFPARRAARLDPAAALRSE